MIHPLNGPMCLGLPTVPPFCRGGKNIKRFGPGSPTPRSSITQSQWQSREWTQDSALYFYVEGQTRIPFLKQMPKKVSSALPLIWPSLGDESAAFQRLWKSSSNLNLPPSIPVPVQ